MKIIMPIADIANYSLHNGHIEIIFEPRIKRIVLIPNSECFFTKARLAKL